LLFLAGFGEDHAGSRAVGLGQVAQALTESMTGHARGKTTVIASGSTAQEC
jgi:hypothetical protein